MMDPTVQAKDAETSMPGSSTVTQLCRKVNKKHFQSSLMDLDDRILLCIFLLRHRTKLENVFKNIPETFRFSC